MPKRKKETIDELIEDVAAAEQTAAAELPQPQLDTDTSANARTRKDESLLSDRKRGELLKLAEDGELDKSVAYIKKAPVKMIEKLYVEYERKRMQKANDFLTDILVSKFSDVLGGFDAIEDPEVLTNELQRDEQLKRDVYSLVEKLTPFLPFIGLLSGCAITAKHIYDYKSKPEVSTPNTDT